LDPGRQRRNLLHQGRPPKSDGDAKNIKTNSEKLSELKVRVYGDTAVATYKDTYDILIMGQRRAHTIIATEHVLSKSMANGSRSQATGLK